jgi:hypothetical protein
METVFESRENLISIASAHMFFGGKIQKDYLLFSDLVMPPSCWSPSQKNLGKETFIFQRCVVQKCLSVVSVSIV